MSFRAVPVSIAAAVGLLVFWGCQDSPTQVPDSGTLSVSVAPDQVQTLSETSFHASYMNDSGGMMMGGLQMMQMEYRLEGTDTWMPVEMFPDTDGYDGTCIFTTSGDYEIRATGMMHGSDHMDDMYHMGDPLHVWRAHQDAGGYRVEFECFPGSVHTGATSTLRFWVSQPGSGGSRVPVTGFDPTIRITESGQPSATATATEMEPGVYAYEHHFEHAGSCEVAFLFRGMDGSDAEAVFHMPVFGP